MTKITLNDLSTISGNEQSAINLINANNATIETASDNTLSRDGTSPNQMLSSLDMNSFRILNCVDAINVTEPATYGQVINLINRVSSGTSSQIVRELLLANRTYYIRTDGSDSNSGLINSAAGAFLTIQHAIDLVLQTIDLGAFNITIQLVDGTSYKGILINSPFVGAGTVTIQGNSATPANVIVDSTSTENSTIEVRNGAYLILKDLEVRNTHTGHSIYAKWGGHIDISNLRFGTAGDSQVVVSFFGTIVAIGTYSITGSAKSHYLTHAGTTRVEQTTVTLTGTPAFSNPFADVVTGNLYVDGTTWSGSATGQRFKVRFNGRIYQGAGSLTTLPGDSAGTIDEFSVYETASNYQGAKVQSNFFNVQDGTDLSKQLALDISTFSTATTRTWTFPNATDTFVGLTGTQSLTNKTIDGPSITVNSGNPTFLTYRVTGVNFNSANTDTTIPINLPTGFTRFSVNRVMITHASGTLTTSTFGVFTAAAAGGTAIIASGTANTVSTASEGTNNNTMLSAGSNTTSFQLASVPNIFFRVQTAQGVAATADVMVAITPLP